MQHNVLVRSRSRGSSQVGLLALVVALLALGVAIVALVRAGGHAHDHAHDDAHTHSTAPPAAQVPAVDPGAPLVAAERPFTARVGRSPIPEPGEEITTPIPAPRLAIEEQGEAPPEGAIIAWDQAANHMGHVITVEGKIVDTHLLASGTICFLNFERGSRESFYLAMFREAFDGMDTPPDRFFLNKTLRVTGRVTTHQGRPQIQVRSLDQIEVVE